MENAPQPEFHTYFFIETHPNSIDNNIEISLETKHPGAQPLKKILEKTHKQEDGAEYMIAVYSGDIIASLIKEKEIKTIENNIKTFPLKLALKSDKNKFETKISPYLDFDCFMPFVKFDPIKKLVGKPIEPPQQTELSPFEYLDLFNEVLLINLNKKIIDPIYIEFLKFSIEILKPLEKIPFKLFLLIYEKIIFSQNIDLLNAILAIFEVDKLENAKSYDEIIKFQDSINIIFTDQIRYIELIKMIPNVDFLLYVIKFYTVIIFYYFQFGNFQTIENILLEIRDRNPYDTLMLHKMFLSQYNHFYRSLEINHEIKMSLINGFIQASFTYDNLITAFSMIGEYVQHDLIIILTIVYQNYEQINQICFNENQSLKINDFIVQKYEDDLAKVQENLINLGQRKLNLNYKAITFNLTMWDVYLNDGKNQQFFEFLETHLIQTSLFLEEIVEALSFIIKYTKKNMALMLDLFVKNYDRLEAICINEKKCINATDYLQPNGSDNIDIIKEKLDCIISNKLKSNFPTLYFKIDIWLFYIVNDFNEEFQLYLEDKLFLGALSFEDICDCLTYGSIQKKRKFSSIIKLIIQNFEKIYTIIARKKISIDITQCIDIKINEDDIQEIYDFICELIRLEQIKGYKVIDFPIKIWEAYSMSQDLDYLRTVRKIIYALREMDKTLNENDINLIQKMHNVGFKYIKEGKLFGDGLLEFLGREEAAYTKSRTNTILNSQTDRQKQLKAQFQRISILLEKKKIIIQRIIDYENRISQLKQSNSNAKQLISNLEENSSNLFRNINESEKDLGHLRSRATF